LSSTNGVYTITNNASGGGSSWSQYPALLNVDMSNYSISNISGLFSLSSSSNNIGGIRLTNHNLIADPVSGTFYMIMQPLSVNDCRLGVYDVCAQASLILYSGGGSQAYLHPTGNFELLTGGFSTGSTASNNIGGVVLSNKNIVLSEPSGSLITSVIGSGYGNFDMNGILGIYNPTTGNSAGNLRCRLHPAGASVINSVGDASSGLIIGSSASNTTAPYQLDIYNGGIRSAVGYSNNIGGVVLSNGNISNSNATSNNIGGVVLSSETISNVSNSSNNIGGVVLSNGSMSTGRGAVNLGIGATSNLFTAISPSTIEILVANTTSGPSGFGFNRRVFTFYGSNGTLTGVISSINYDYTGSYIDMFVSNNSNIYLSNNNGVVASNQAYVYRVMSTGY